MSLTVTPQIKKLHPAMTDEELNALPVARRAMIAARIITVESGEHAGPGSITSLDAAKMLGLSRGAVGRARMVLRHAEPDVVRGVDSGLLPIGAAYASIETPKGKKVALKFIGKNPARVERLRQRAVIAKHLRDAITGLTSLPLPADVLSVAREMDRKSGIIKNKLPGALAWLEEFANVCHGATASPERDEQDTGDGDTAAEPADTAV